MIPKRWSNYYHTEDQVAAVRRAILHWEFIWDLGTKIDRTALREAKSGAGNPEHTTHVVAKAGFDPAYRLHHVGAQPHRVLVRGVDVDPGERPALALGGEPLGEQRRLAEAARGAEQGELAPRPPDEALDQLWSVDRPLTNRGRSNLRLHEGRRHQGMGSIRHAKARFS